MNPIIEDYLRDVETSLRAPPEQKKLIVTELRGHLQEKLADLRAAAPDRADDDLAREVVRDLGNPHDLALAYTPEGGAVLKNSTGDTVLRVGKAVGRGAGKVLKYTAIGLAVLLVIGVGAGVWAYYEIKPLIEKNAPYPLYSIDPTCSHPCNTSQSQSFYVHPEAREVRMSLSAHGPGDFDERRPIHGTLHVLVTAPDGTVKYNHTFTALRSTHEEITWSAAQGDWTVAYRLESFEGALNVDVIAIGLPKDAWFD
ncbi:MAG TPA: hypothetical protein VNZ52_10825 [Candidatus Thermoplasmatota archaeon]|nr:hypothetical protein [Candidatus Thermoplasmatota archaeon]